MILLLEKHALLEELIEAAVGDVLDHLLREVGSLLSSHFLFYLADFVGISLGDVALHDTLFEVVFILSDVEIEAFLLQSVLNGFFHLLLFSLVDGDSELLVDNLLGHSLAANANGVHGCYLHGNLLAYLSGYVGEIEANDSGELVAKVLVSSYALGLNPLVVAEFHLLTCFTDLVSDVLSHGAAVVYDSLHLVEAFCLGVKGNLEDLLCESTERLVLCHEVGFALKGNDCSKVAVGAGEHAALGGVAVLALCGYGLTLLADDFYGCLDVAVGLCQGVLAVHHACAGHVAQFLDIFNANCHNVCSLNIIVKN